MRPAFEDCLNEIKLHYTRERYVFIPGETINYLLRALGCDQSQISELQDLGKYLISDPSLNFRKSSMSRFGICYKTQEISELETQPFILTAQDEFVRFDSGKPRVFDELSNALVNNRASKSLLTIKSLLIQDMPILERENLTYSSDFKICTTFHLQTITTRERIGQPAAEGVHTDGAEHTMTILLSSKNLTTYSASTRIHNYIEKTGTPYESADQHLIINHYRHSNFLDTLILVDSELKHSVSPVHQADIDIPATRDMLVIFTRSPMSDSNPHKKFDTFNSKTNRTINFSLTSKN